MFELANGALSATPRYRKNALGRAPVNRQAVGTVHVHPKPAEPEPMGLV
jgi:hypothetical protein